MPARPQQSRGGRAALALWLLPALGACTLAGGPPVVPPPEVVLPAPEPAAAAMAATPFAGFVRHAVLAGPATRAAIARVAAADAAAEGAARAYWPDLSLSLRAAGESLASGSAWGLAPALTLAQPLFDGGAGRRSAEAAEARLRGAGAAQAAALTAEALAVIEAAAAVELAAERYRLAEDDSAAHLALRDGIAQRARAGTGTEGEVLAAEGRLAAAEAAAIGAAGALRAAQARLAERAGPGAAAPRLPVAPVLGPVPLAGAATPDVALRQADLAAAEAELAAAEARRLPVLGLTLGAERPVGGGGTETSATLGLDATVDGSGRKRSAVRAAAARLEEARAALDTALRAAERARVQAADAVATARAQAAAAARAAEAERAAYRAAETEVARGRRAATALLDARREVTRAEAAHAEARVAERLAGWRLLAIDGRLLSALGLPLPGAAPVVPAGTGP